MRAAKSSHDENSVAAAAAMLTTLCVVGIVQRAFCYWRYTEQRHSSMELAIFKTNACCIECGDEEDNKNYDTACMTESHRLVITQSLDALLLLLQQDYYNEVNSSVHMIRARICIWHAIYELEAAHRMICDTKKKR